MLFFLSILVIGIKLSNSLFSLKEMTVKSKHVIAKSHDLHFTFQILKPSYY